jgi:hypothetical protein
MNLKLLAVVFVLCAGMLYWTWRNSTEMDRIQKEAFQTGLQNNLEMEGKIKLLEQREGALLEENAKLITQVNEYKMEIQRLSLKPEQPKSKKKNEKTVPISKSASKRITEFLSKRYETE